METYVVVKQSPAYHQMSLEEYLFASQVRQVVTPNETNTRTYVVTDNQSKLLKIDVVKLIDLLHEFNEKYEDLHAVENKHELYREFRIPKKSGGLRKIDAPEERLMKALRELKDIFEDEFHVLSHTSAFAYVKGRCHKDAIVRHQQNESKWFLKLDFHDFFGSTTPEFIEQMLSKIHPFAELMVTYAGKQELRRALSLAYLDGGLPQGTPLSPLLTNIMMIPIDYKLANALRSYNKQHYVYTRYADDMVISSKYQFKFRDIERLVLDALEEFNAPFSLNTKKTRYGSANGSNWNLGLMLNEKNQITVGAEKKRVFKAMINAFVLDTKNGNEWSLEDLQHMEGLRNYYTSIEPDTINGLLEKTGSKYSVNVRGLIKSEIKRHLSA